MMNTRIAVCGHDAAVRQGLIRNITPPGTVPETVPAGSQTIYETEEIDYLDCAVSPQKYEDFQKAIREDFELDFNSADSEKADVIWYCIDGKSSQDELNSLSGFVGRVLFIVTDGDELKGEALEERVAFLEKFGLDKEKTIFVSLTNKTGLVLLVNRTMRMLGGSFKKMISEATEWNKQISEEADSFIYWAAGRAFAIAIIPLPLADVGPLIANEAYMFYKLGTLYGYAVDKTILAGFLGCLGASVGGKIAASFIPFLKAPIAAGITYAVGCAAKAYFESDMKLEAEELRNIFRKAKKSGEKINWETKQ